MGGRATLPVRTTRRRGGAARQARCEELDVAALSDRSGQHRRFWRGSAAGAGSCFAPRAATFSHVIGQGAKGGGSEGRAFLRFQNTRINPPPRTPTSSVSIDAPGFWPHCIAWGYACVWGWPMQDREREVLMVVFGWWREHQQTVIETQELSQKLTSLGLDGDVNHGLPGLIVNGFLVRKFGSIDADAKRLDEGAQRGRLTRGRM